MDIGDILCCGNKDELKDLIKNCSIEGLQKCVEDFYDMMHSICDQINKY